MSLDALTSCLRARVEACPGLASGGVLVAHSGGPDSTALLAGLALAWAGRAPRLAAAHLDHGQDPGSGERAAVARRAAAALGVPFHQARIDVAAGQRAGEGWEEAARRQRYAWLERLADELGLAWIATGHHRDDQAETVLLRLRMGSGLVGLRGIQRQRGRLLRPLLDFDRASLAAAVASLGLATTDDPGNRDLAVTRNRLRLAVLPALERGDPGLGARLARLATLGERAAARLEQHLDIALAPLERSEPTAVTIELDRFLTLPASLRLPALAWLARQIGSTYPPSQGVLRELERQLARGAVGHRVDAGAGRSLSVIGTRLEMRRSLGVCASSQAQHFTYTFRVPGRIEIASVGVGFRLHRQPPADWMAAGDPHRAALALPLVDGDPVTVRSRRPGDRIQPLGAAGEQSLAHLLINRRVPRAERDRLPLLEVQGRIAWVPGVTLDQRFRIDRPTPNPCSEVWVAEVLPS